MRVVREHRIGFASISQHSGPFDLPAGSRPTITLLGDDTEVACGPTAFDLASVERIIARAAVVAIISCEPLLVVYESAAKIGVLGGDVVLIETRIEHEISWVSLIQHHAPGVPLLIATVEAARA